MLPESEFIFLFLPILAVVAFLYASVGHGGASGYLALMAMFSFPVEMMKPTALLLNVFVAGVSFWFFRKHQHFRWKLFYPFALSSIPASFLGGYLSIDPTLYKQILGVFLIVAVLRMVDAFGTWRPQAQSPSLLWSLLIGLGIGLFSGMIGIGGGIILSPVIVLLGWGNLKEAAAVSALFIFVNSVAGLSGFLVHAGTLSTQSLGLIPVALAGGTLGAMAGSNKLSSDVLRYVLAAVLLIASVKLFLV